jgi:hypothetical protein
MTVEIRQLIIRAVVVAPAQDLPRSNDADLVARCARLVLRQLARRTQR